MTNLLLSIIASTALPLIVYIVMRARTIRLERERYIRRCTFSAGLFAKVREKYPVLEDKDLYLVAKALRQYFLIHSRARNKIIGMPSKVVDEMWHAFILDTRKYTAFCKNAFGAYFHHLPAPITEKGTPVDNQLRATWRLACLEENINPGKATRLPLLFAIDQKLNIPDGNIHKLSPHVATANSGPSGCGGIACSGMASSDASGDGSNGSCSASDSGASGSGGDSGCSGGCGGGCGGGD